MQCLANYAVRAKRSVLTLRSRKLKKNEYPAKVTYNLRLERWLYFPRFHSRPVDAAEEGMGAHILLPAHAAAETLLRVFS